MSVSKFLANNTNSYFSRVIFELNFIFLNVQSLKNNKINVFNSIIFSFNFLFLCLTKIHCTGNFIVIKKNYFKLSSFVCRFKYEDSEVIIFAKQKTELLEIDLKKYCTEKHSEFCAVVFCLKTTTI